MKTFDLHMKCFPKSAPLQALQTLRRWTTPSVSIRPQMQSSLQEPFAIVNEAVCAITPALSLSCADTTVPAGTFTTHVKEVTYVLPLRYTCEPVVLCTARWYAGSPPDHDSSVGWHSVAPTLHDE
jgi:hypothetical protein